MFLNPELAHFIGDRLMHHVEQIKKIVESSMVDCDHEWVMHHYEKTHEVVAKILEAVKGGN